MSKELDEHRKDERFTKPDPEYRKEHEEGLNRKFRRILRDMLDRKKRDIILTKAKPQTSSLPRVSAF